MPQSNTTLKGVVHGKTIELDEETGLPDGQQVTIQLRPLQSVGQGIRRSAGAWADAGDDIDSWLEEMQRSRLRDRPGLP